MEAQKVRRVHVTVEFDVFTSISPKQYNKDFWKATNLGTHIKHAILKLTPRGLDNFKIETSGEWEEARVQ